MADGVQLGGGAFGVGQHIFNGVTIFALQAVDQVQPLLHLLQAPGVELDAVAVVRQLARQIVHQRGRFAQLLDQGGRGGVKPRQPRQCLLGRAQGILRASHLLIAARKRHDGFVAQRGQLFGVRQAAALGVQFRFFLRFQPGRAHFFHLVG